jgi:hypothetical protein
MHAPRLVLLPLGAMANHGDVGEKLLADGLLYAASIGHDS